MLRSLWQAFQTVRDRSAWLLGASFLDWRAQVSTCLAVCFVLFLLALLLPPLPAIPIVLLNLGLLVAVYAAWIANERRRGRIAKKIEANLLHEMPDLWWLALLVFFLLPVFLLLLIGKMQSAFGVFHVREDRTPSLMDLAWFFVDKTYLRAWPDALDLVFTRIDNLHGGMLNYHEGWAGWPGRGLILFAYLTIYAVLLQGLMRWWQVWRDETEGVAGVGLDPDMAVRLGRRAVRPLLYAWKHPEEILDGQRTSENDAVQRVEKLLQIRTNLVIALARIGDPQALPILREAARPEWPDSLREAALEGLAYFSDDESVCTFLERILADRSESIAARAGAGVALGRMNLPRAIEFLIGIQRQFFEKKRFNEPPRVQKKIVAALGEFVRRQRERGVPTAEWVEQIVPLLVDPASLMLDHPALRVRNATARTLAELGDPRGVEAILSRLQTRKDDPPMANNPILIHDTIEALGKLVEHLGPTNAGTYPRADVLNLFKDCMNDTNEKVVQASVLALGDARAHEERDYLEKQLDHALRKGIESQSTALKTALVRIDPSSRERWEEMENTIGTRASQRRRRTLLDPESLAEERIKAAEELGRYGDERGIKALRKALANEQTPAELKLACRNALQAIQSKAK